MPVRLNVDGRAMLLALAGLALLIAAPPHRLDLPLYGAAAYFAAVLWRPWVGPASLGAAIPFFLLSRERGLIPLSPPGLALGLSYLALAVTSGRALARRQPTGLSWPRSSLAPGLALFLVAALLSLLVTQYPRLSARELRSLVLEPVLFFWLLVLLKRVAQPRFAILGFVAGACILATAALAQLALGLGGTEAEGVRRAQAWYPSPNHLALTLGRALPFVLVLALLSHAGRARIAASFAVGLVGLASVLTFSLGGWLGLLASVTTVLWATGRTRAATRFAAATGVLLIVASTLAALGILPERLSPLRASGGLRWELWLSSIEMARDHPLLGIGLDNFVYLYQQIYLREGAASEPNLSHPHNWILHLWLQLGLLGLAAFIWLVAQAWRAGLRQLRSRVSWPVAGALGCLAATLVHGLIDNSYFLPDLAFLFWLTMAALTVCNVKGEGAARAPG